MFSTPHTLLRRAAVPAAALLAGSALAISSADGQSARTVTVEGSAPTAREAVLVDRRPHGLSNGDQYMLAISLRSGNRLVGRAHVMCTIIDRRFGGQDCDWVLVLRDGTVTASGGGLHRRLPGQSPPPHGAADDSAITGGTGAYSGASGVMSVLSHKDESVTITLAL